MCMCLTACGRVGFDSVTSRVADSGPDSNAPQSYPALIRSDRPVAYWRFEETGTAVNDEIGTAVGAIEGTVARAPGIVGTALVFDGETTRVDFGDVLPFAGNHPYTIELWARPTPLGTTVRFLVQRQIGVAPTPSGYQLYHGEDFVLASREISGAEDGYANGPRLISDVFVHIVATYDGTSSALYLDTALHAGAQSLPLPAGPGGFTLGDRVPGQFFKFLGAMDEVAMYDRALDIDRITAHYLAGKN